MSDGKIELSAVHSERRSAVLREKPFTVRGEQFID